MKSCQHSNAFRGDHRQSHHRRNMQHNLYRLDSAGEDTKVIFPFQGQQSRLVAGSSSPLHSPYVRPKVSNGLRSGSSLSLSRSLPIPLQSYPAAGRQFSTDRQAPTFLKSHSLSDFGSNMHGKHLVQQPYRSISVGSASVPSFFGFSSPPSKSKNSSTCKEGSQVLFKMVSGMCTGYAQRKLDCSPTEENCQSETSENHMIGKGQSSSCGQSVSRMLSSPEKMEQLKFVDSLPQSDIQNGDEPQENSTATGGLSKFSLSFSTSDVTESTSEVTNMSSILFSPRKKCKKGRPSSKKQRKRKREKQRQASVNNTMASPLEKQNSGLSDLLCSSGLDNNPPVMQSNSTQSPQCSTPKKPNSHHSIVNCFIYTTASSDSESASQASGQTSESDDDDSWSDEDEAEAVPCVSPVNTFGLSIALNLDSIFKNNCLSSHHNLATPDGCDDSESDPGSVAKARKASGVHLSVSVFSLSDEENPDDSIEFDGAASPCVGEYVCLSSKEGNGKTSKSSVPHLKHSTISKTDCDKEDVHKVDLLDLQAINTKWNDVYASKDACDCCNLNSEDTSSPVYKVQFMEGPKLLTVHIVDVEDRAGTWHHFALDRERFSRRISEAEGILSPILQKDHRESILMRNLALLRQSGDE